MNFFSIAIYSYSCVCSTFKRLFHSYHHIIFKRHGKHGFCVPQPPQIKSDMKVWYTRKYRACTDQPWNPSFIIGVGRNELTRGCTLFYPESIRRTNSFLLGIIRFYALIANSDLLSSSSQKCLSPLAPGLKNFQQYLTLMSLLPSFHPCTDRLVESCHSFLLLGNLFTWCWLRHLVLCSSSLFRSG